MGFGNYSYEAHQQITTARAGMQAAQVFSQSSEINPKMNPKGVKFRESRDGADHPNSLPICFALDISGSMGDIPDHLARKELPTFMRMLLDCGIDHPQILMMAFADARYDVTPLQVGQFESTAELIDKWLTTMSLFSSSRGTSYTGSLQGGESYELALWFAARHTQTDRVQKHGKRGYLFMTGDETGYPAVPRETVKTVLGYDPERDIPIAEVMTELRKSYNPFFLIPDPGRAKGVEQPWKEIFGRDVITMQAPADTCAVAASLVALGEGVLKDAAAVEAALRKGKVANERITGTLKAIHPWLASR
jgi:hypothetical protein